MLKFTDRDRLCGRHGYVVDIVRVIRQGEGRFRLSSSHGAERWSDGWLGEEAHVEVGGLGVSLDDGWLEERGKVFGGRILFLFLACCRLCCSAIVVRL